MNAAIGTISKTGAMKVADDCYVADWIWKRAPFKARPANALSNNWRVDNYKGVAVDLNISEEEAKAKADQYNTWAATAQLLKE
jgi:hypothetical protein